MKSGMNATKDLNPIVLNVLKDKQWHTGQEIMLALSGHITDGRAYGFYQSMSKRRLEKGDSVGELSEENVNRGKRRGVYLCLQGLVGRNLVVCKKEGYDFEYRQFMLSEESEVLGSNSQNMELFLSSLAEVRNRFFANCIASENDTVEFEAGLKLFEVIARRCEWKEE